MSWSDTIRLLPRVAAVVIAAAALGGCFRPMYAVSPDGTSVQDQLASIEVATINPGNHDNPRLAYYTQSELTYRLSGGAPGETPKRYRLETSVRESITSTIVNTSTGNAEAALLKGQADFRLVPVEGGEPVYSGQALASSAYDRTPQRFAALRAARDAQIRVATALAEQIKTRIAAQFAGQKIRAGR
ncbi:LPS assembly lipoprotein LptE [Pseudochelatococcus contaminans]|uniref:LPS-assembly lipoprotein n=1 Tax=Pseudochelatococcus contaminans TaxID=1538103 RepID=A0A7W6EF82_9HYPH|nr:LPS assembly lipoprotein LptE [Pseudochelatococcus contaminans]MBB3808192.1 LPS-assembly lipoprotein [Pseudochelatococcus contaminans]